MTEMLDRVKAAIQGELGAYISPRKAEVAARAAIEAMRPELEAIRKELSDNAADLGGDGYFRRSEDVSRLVARIDAALAEDTAER